MYVCLLDAFIAHFISASKRQDVGEWPLILAKTHEED